MQKESRRKVEAGTFADISLCERDVSINLIHKTATSISVNDSESIVKQVSSDIF